MTIETTTPETTSLPPAPKVISDPSLSFADYEKLRRGETVPASESHASAPVEKSIEQKKAVESETTETESKEDEPTESEESESGSENDSKDEKSGKKKGGFQRRIDKLNQQKAQAQQEAEFWRQQALKGAGGESKTEQKLAEPKPDSEGKPKPDDFENHSDYVEALTDWKTDQKFKEQAQKQEKSKAESEQQKIARDYQDRAKSFAEKTPDFKEVLAEVDEIRISPVVHDIILSSPNGPELAYELAKNPEEFEHVCKLPPIAAAREMGKVEARIASKSSEKKQEQKITKAPKPLEPVGGGQSPSVKKSPEEMSYAEYERYRRDQAKRKG